MNRTAVRFHPDLIWMGAAILLGVLIARLPVPIGGAAVVGSALLIVVLVEPSLGLILMLGVAPLKTLIATEAPGIMPVDIGQMAFALVVGSWALRRVSRFRTAPLPFTPLVVPLLLIMLSFGPSLWNAISGGAWLSEMLKWIEMVLLVLIVLDLGRERWTWIAFGAVLAAALQALIGLYEFRGGSGAPHLWIDNYRFFRAFGTFGQPNPFSAFMGLALPLTLGLAWGYASKAWGIRAVGWQRGASWPRGASWREPLLLALIYAGCAVIILGGLIASWGRGAWMGFGAAVTVMVFFFPRQRWKGVLLMGTGGVLFAALWLSGLLPAGIQQRIQNTMTEFVGFGDMRAVPVNDENFAIVERLAHWQAAYNMASDHPWIGVGLGNYEAAYPHYGIPSWPRPLGHAHNDYLNLLAETGLIGLLVYLFGWAWIVRWTLRALHQSDPVVRGMVLGLLGVWTHLAVHSVVDKLYVNNLFLYVGVMLGLLATALPPYRRGSWKLCHQ